MLRTIFKKLQDGVLQEMLQEIRWIYSYTIQYKKSILLYLLLSIALTAAGLGASISSKYIIDAVISRSVRLLPLAVCYVLLYLSKIGLSSLANRFRTQLSVRASNEIRADVFSRFLDVDWQASLEYHSGDLLSRVNGDVTTVSNSVLGLLPSFAVNSMQLLAILLVMLFYDPIMALIALLSAPLSVLLSRFFLIRLRRYSQKVREAQAAMMAFYEEALQNLQAIKAFSLNETFRGRLDDLQTIYQDLALEQNRFSIFSNLLMSMASFAVSCLCLGWGIYRLWNGQISFGTMALFIQLAGMVSTSFSSIISLIPTAISSTVSAGRIMAILALPMESHEIPSSAAAVLEQAPQLGVNVRAEHVAFSYSNGRLVFEDLCLHAAPGEIIGIVSPSGGGKTTLIRMLLGLITPAQGQILFQSGDASSPFSPCLRQLVSYVAQEKVVFSGTIADSLRLSNPGADDTALRKALELACAWDFVSALPHGLYTKLRERGSGLSEGQIQRLAIARALLSSAPVLLLDEATSALDMKTERQVLQNLRSDTAHRTVIVTTHRPTVLLSCRRVYAISDHRAVLLSPAQVQDFLSEHEES